MSTHRRFDRTARLLGDDGVARLATSTVTVFGVGGVGSFAAEALVRSGVGRLILVDFDRICVTNVNRQLHAMKGTLGKPKVAVMAERLRLINPDAVIEPRAEFYGAATSARLLSPEPDLVIDAIDNVTAKMHLIATCVRERLRIVSTMGAAARLDPTRIRVGDLADTKICPFARDLRKSHQRQDAVGGDREEPEPRDLDRRLPGREGARRLVDPTDQPARHRRRRGRRDRGGQRVALEVGDPCRLGLGRHAQGVLRGREGLGRRRRLGRQAQLAAHREGGHRQREANGAGDRTEANGCAQLHRRPRCTPMPTSITRGDTLPTYTADLRERNR
jgi:tRNA A37 threonylcarbamoyladenosine dehydratase